MWLNAAHPGPKKFPRPFRGNRRYEFLQERCSAVDYHTPKTSNAAQYFRCAVGITAFLPHQVVVHRLYSKEN